MIVNLVNVSRIQWSSWERREKKECVYYETKKDNERVIWEYDERHNQLRLSVECKKDRNWENRNKWKGMTKNCNQNGSERKKWLLVCGKFEILKLSIVRDCIRN